MIINWLQILYSRYWPQNPRWLPIWSLIAAINCSTIFQQLVLSYTLQNKQFWCHFQHAGRGKSWDRESWTIQVKYRFETKQGRITISYDTTHRHGHAVLVCICPLEGGYFNHLECSYNTWYVCNNKLNTQSRTKVIRRKHIIQPGFSICPTKLNKTRHI